MSVFVRDYRYNLQPDQTVKITTGGSASYFGFLAGDECLCTFDSQSPITLSGGLGVEFTGSYEFVEIRNLSPSANAVHAVTGAGRILDSRLSVSPAGLGITVNGVNPLINPEVRLPVVTPKDLARFQIRDFSNIQQSRDRLFIPGTSTPSADDAFAADILISHVSNSDGSELRVAHESASPTPDWITLQVGDELALNGPIYINDPAYSIYVWAQTGDSIIQTAGRFFK